MTIQEKINIRFVSALARLKSIDVRNNIFLLKEVTKKYLQTEITSTTQFAIQLMNDEEFLIKVVAIIALMEASSSWDKFEELFKKQKETINSLEFTYEDGNEVDFEAVLKKILKH